MMEINWFRFGVYFVVGVPFLIWIFLTSNDRLRALAVLSVLIFVELSFAYRRELFGFGLGPSTLISGAALLTWLARGYVPALGAYGVGWLVFLLSSFVAVAIGGFAGPAPLYNEFSKLQEHYLEAFLFFVLGMIALSRTSANGRLRFLVQYICIVALGVAVAEFFCVATGFRFRDFAQRTAQALSRVEAISAYGGVFNNPNSLGAYFVMTIPPAIILMARAPMALLTRWWLGGTIVLMAGACFLANARGGIYLSLLLGMVAVAVGSARLGQGLRLAILAVLGLVATYGVLVLVAPEAFAGLFAQLQEQGLETTRLELFQQYAALIAHYPMGLGLTNEAAEPTVAAAGIHYSTPHNIYLEHAVRTGWMGLISFLLITIPAFWSMLRAARSTKSEPEKTVLLFVGFVVAGFLVAGIIEPLYHNRYKVMQIFWFFTGFGVTLSREVLSEARSRSTLAGHPSAVGARGSA